MEVECIPLTSFIHNRIDARQDRPIMIPSGVAADLERAGLVRIKSARVVPVRAAPVRAAQGNSTAAGQDIPSSSSPAAQVSPSTTLRLPKRGETQRKTGTR